MGELSVFNEFVAFYRCLVFFLFFLQIYYFSKMKNIFLFFYLPCVILEAKTFQRKTDLREKDVGSPEIPQSRTWETLVQDYKNMMDPSKCTQKKWKNKPCVEGRRVGCSFLDPSRSGSSDGIPHAYWWCWRSSGEVRRGWQWTRFFNEHYTCGGNEDCKYIEWFYHEHGGYAHGYDMAGSGRDAYDEIRRLITQAGGQP